MTSTHAYDLKVKVTDIQMLYLIPEDVKFMTTNDQKKVREKSRKCHNHKPQPLADTKP